MNYQRNLPPGYHDADSAAEALGISKRELMKRLREMGWLVANGDARNLPRRPLISAGLLSTQDRSYCLKGRREIVKTYRVMILTERGFQELQKRMNAQPDNTPATTKTGTVTPIKKPAHEKPKLRSAMTEAEKEAADRERERALADLKKIGMM